jgi:hypothetical protein
MRTLLPFVLLSALVACESSKKEDTGGTGTTDSGEDTAGTTEEGGGDEGGDDGSGGTGTAELFFTLHLDAEAVPGIELTGCIEGSLRESFCDEDQVETLVFMLCETSDPTCQAPVLLRAATDAENEEGTLAQDPFGTDMRLQELPAGDYLFMMFIDSRGSIEAGQAWTDASVSPDGAWGGVVSPGDALLATPGEVPNRSYNPEPMAWPVSLQDGQATEIFEDPPRRDAGQTYGSIWLSHTMMPPEEG